MGHNKGEGNNEDIEFQDILHNGGSALQMHYNEDLKRLIEKRDREHSCWGFKYPALHQYHGALASIKRGAKFIYVLRDPLAVTMSEARQADGTKNFQYVLSRTCEYNAKMVQLSRGNSDVHLISYERLITRPWATIGALLQFMDVNYNAAKIVELCELIKLPNDRYRKNSAGFVS